MTFMIKYLNNMYEPKEKIVDADSYEEAENIVEEEEMISAENITGTILMEE